MHILSIVGARPQFVKVAMIAAELHKCEAVGAVHHTLVHTGQHYDRSMSDTFFNELSIPAPQHNLEVGSGIHGKQTAAMLERIEQVLEGERPDVVMVYGDTNSTIAGALAAAKLNIPIAHVEAGLRSFNRKMPEEVNRVIADHLSTILLCPTRSAVENLGNEGITKGVHLVGDVMLDAVLSWRQVARTKSCVLQRLHLRTAEYVLLTMHRAENTQSPDQTAEFFDSLLNIPYPVVFPVHPRMRGWLDREPALRGLRDRLACSERIRLIEPVSYLDMLALEDKARVIVTDSGGVQKEAYFLGVPCLTIRSETEWLETLDGGWNRLIGSRAENMGPMLASLWNNNGATPTGAPDLRLFGNGEAAKKIIGVVAGEFTGLEVMA